MEQVRAQVTSLEQRFTEFSSNIKEVMRIHNETHAKEHEIYQGAFVDRMNTVAQSLNYVQTQLQNISSKSDVHDLEQRVRQLEIEIQALKTDKKSDDENRAMWILVALTLLSAIFGLLSNVIGYVIS